MLPFDGDFALSHARFIGFDEQQADARRRRSPGNDIPNEPAIVASAGIEIGEGTGLFGALCWRYLGASPLKEDGVFRSPPTSTLQGPHRYRFGNGWRVALNALNLFHAKTNQITYAYGSLIKSDSLYATRFPASGAPTAPAAVRQNGVMDYELHPMEPLAVRLTLTSVF